METKSGWSNEMVIYLVGDQKKALAGQGTFDRELQELLIQTLWKKVSRS